MKKKHNSDGAKHPKLSPKKENNQNEKKLKNEIVELKNAVNINCEVIIILEL